MLRALQWTATAFALVVAAGCTSARSTASAPVHRTGTTLDANDIASTGATNVYDAIQRLRPQWLTSARIRRGGSGDDLVVYLDSNRYGSTNSLRQISLGGVQEVRYFGATEATNRYGTGHTGGAILVLMSKP